MNISDDDYNEVKDCTYKEEHYSVRDNGAIMRHQREGMRKRKLDGVWSFGTPNATTGYMDFCGERVHRIVATAFHGQAPSEQHVVDHIDTNRHNNRPSNLRWLTKLENILNNEITRKKVELICGSVEAFLNDPQLLFGYETEDSNFSWMKNVTKEEAQNCLANWSHWAKTAKPDPNYKKAERHVDDWIYNKPSRNEDNPFMNIIPDGRGGYRIIDTHAPAQNANPIMPDEVIEKHEPLKTQSLTPNAVQLDWKNPVTFPCCPQEYSGNPLEVYMANLKEGSKFSTSNYGESIVLRYGMPQPDCLWVMCSIRIGFMSHAFTKITFKDGIFYHENMGVYDVGDEPEEIFESILNRETE